MLTNSANTSERECFSVAESGNDNACKKTEVSYNKDEKRKGGNKNGQTPVKNGFVTGVSEELQ